MAVGHDRLLDDALAALAAGHNRDPFALLGPHPAENGRGVVVRAFQPAAVSIDLLVVATGERRTMTPGDTPGLFEAHLPQDADYRLRITYPGGHQIEADDPYRYGRVLTDFDLHLLGEGTHHRMFEKLGSHCITFAGTRGVHFAVWAPNADRVSVVRDFNGWDGRVTRVRRLVPGGIWEIFVPDLSDEEKYKFEIRAESGAILKKTDPVGIACEVRPPTAALG